VLPQPVVAHLHMIALMAIAVRADAEAVLGERLAGLDWAFIPYLKPGLAVAQALLALLERSRPQIIILGNHGVVIAGADFAEVDALIDDLRSRLDSGVAVSGVPDRQRLEAAARSFGLEPARLDAAHLPAFHPAALAWAVSGSLYPDHVVFLGRGAACLVPGEGTPSAETALFYVPGAGALLRPGLSMEAHEMAACLGEVVMRIEDGAPLRVLSAAEEDELIDWDAEKYRRMLADKGR